jgi:hypothetical protein
MKRMLGSSTWAALVAIAALSFLGLYAAPAMAGNRPPDYGPGYQSPGGYDARGQGSGGYDYGRQGGNQDPRRGYEPRGNGSCGDSRDGAWSRDGYGDGRGHWNQGRDRNDCGGGGYAQSSGWGGGRHGHGGRHSGWGHRPGWDARGGWDN